MTQFLALRSPGEIVKFLVTSTDGSSYEVLPVTLGTAPEAASVTSAVVPVTEVSSEERSRVPLPQREVTGKELEEGILQAINRAREEKGLSPLKENLQLQEVARRHSEDMANRHFFGHLDLSGRDVIGRLQAEGIKDFTAAGENIFTGKKIGDPVQITVGEWLKSPSHRKNLLNPRYTVGGAGIAWGEQETIYVTQVYLAR